MLLLVCNTYYRGQKWPRMAFSDASTFYTSSYIFFFFNHLLIISTNLSELKRKKTRSLKKRRPKNPVNITWKCQRVNTEFEYEPLTCAFLSRFRIPVQTPFCLKRTGMHADAQLELVVRSVFNCETVYGGSQGQRHSRYLAGVQVSVSTRKSGHHHVRVTNGLHLCVQSNPPGNV